MRVPGISKNIRWTYFEENSNKIRLITVICAIGCILLHEFIVIDRNPSFIFNIVMVLAGVSLFNVVMQVVVSFIVTMIISLLSPFGIPHPIYFMIHWFSSFVICYLISYLIKMNIREYRSTSDFVRTLARTIESRDNYTAHHSMNVAKYAMIIAEELNYSKAECETIFIGALLHDIGKIGINDSILNKPTRLTNEEYTYIQQHPVIGHNMLKIIEAFQENRILDMILYHHERYDGTGYPSGLKAHEIPQCAAIIAIADAFDAMTSKRIYRDGHDLNYALKEIRRNSGSQFDPHIADVFIQHMSNNVKAINAV